MILSKEELEIIYSYIPEGDLKEKIKSFLFVNKDLVEDIKRTFPDVASIWKSCNSNSYYAKFYDKNPDDAPFRIKKAIALENKYTFSTEIQILELDLKDKGTSNDWMYSGCDLIYERDQNVLKL